MKQISIREQDEFIKLGQALKKANLVSSGVEAKIVRFPLLYLICRITPDLAQFVDR